MPGQVIIRFEKNSMQFLLTNGADTVIDGANTIVIPQNTNHPVQLEAGNHRIQMSFQYMGSICGATFADFQLFEGQTLYLTYIAPAVVTGSGQIVIRDGGVGQDQTGQPYQQPYQNQAYQNQSYQQNPYQTGKSKIAAGLLGIFLGGIGIHKFYLGSIGLGIVYILFCWTGIPAIIGFVEGIIYLTMSDEQFAMKYGMMK